MPTDIKANELRKGNCASLAGETGYILTVGNTCAFKTKTSTIRVVTDELKPIQITEERLLRFGFKKEEFWEDYILKKEVFFQDDDCFGLIKCLDGFKFCVDSETGFNTINEKSYNYLHEIQNLYFALTNIELVCQ